MVRAAPKLNDVFKALADPTRRAILERLASGPAGTSALAQHFDMSLPAFAQHLAVLEESGLVKSIKLGRTRMYKLMPTSLAAPQRWLRSQRETWNGRYDHIKRQYAEMKKRHR